MTEQETKKRRPGPYDDAPRLPSAARDAREPDAMVDVRALFAASAPTRAWFELEVGPGPKAGFLVERAAAAPEAGLVGLEIRKKWAAVGDARLAKLYVDGRARVFCENALLALSRLGPDAVFERAFLHFPDPWWKKRHHKRLVMGDVFLDEVARLVRPGGELYVQTDVEERAELYERVVTAHPSFVPAGDAPPSPRVAENPYQARSPREHRAIADGLPVFRMLWKRR